MDVIFEPLASEALGALRRKLRLLFPLCVVYRQFKTGPAGQMTATAKEEFHRVWYGNRGHRYRRQHDCRGVVDASGRLLAKTEIATQLAGTYPEAIQLIASMLRGTAAKANAPIEGIGIGSTGPVDPISGKFCYLDTIPQWSWGAPVADLAKEFGVSVAMENDADAGAFAEGNWGTRRTTTRLICVTAGAGIGSGQIFDGQLYRGVDGAHPEVAHQVLDAHGPPCSCGLSGCWEALAAGPAMARWMESQPEYSGPPRLSVRRIYGLADQSDGLARRTVDREVFCLGMGWPTLSTYRLPMAFSSEAAS